MKRRRFLSLFITAFILFSMTVSASNNGSADVGSLNTGGITGPAASLPGINGNQVAGESSSTGTTGATGSTGTGSTTGTVTGSTTGTTSTSGSYTSKYQSALEEAENQQKELEKALAKANSIVKDLQGSKKSMEQKLRELDGQLNNYSNQVMELEQQMAILSEEIAVTEAALEEANKKANEQYDAMKLRIQYIYENGSMNTIDMLLSASDFSQFLNMIEYIKSINDYDRAMLTAFEEMKKYQTSVSEKLQTQYAEVKQMEAETEAQKQAVSVLRTAKNSELKETMANLSEAEQEAKAYEEEVKAQAEILAQIRKQIEEEEKARKAAAAAGVEYVEASLSTSAFAWPCPKYSYISSDYGNRKSPTSGASTNHQGVDMAAPYGSDILAAESGTVATVSYSNAAGNYVIINHGRNDAGKLVCTVYMHCSSTNVSEGQYVSRGQCIAKVGSTGVSTGNHLHFGVSVGGSYVSPWGYISKP